MIGPAGTDVYWMRLGPVELSPVLQSYIHVRVSVQGIFRVVYVGHEFMRRANPKANWEASDPIRIPLDDAARCQILIMVMGKLWTLLMGDLVVETLMDLEWSQEAPPPMPARTLTPMLSAPDSASESGGLDDD